MFWAASFSGGLQLGDDDLRSDVQEIREEGEPVTIDSGHFFAGVKADGIYARVLKLSIFSDFGISGSQLLPFGGPAANDPVDETTSENTRFLLKGSPVTLEAPESLFLDIKGDDITESAEENDEDQGSPRRTTDCLRVPDRQRRRPGRRLAGLLVPTEQRHRDSDQLGVQYALRVFFDVRKASPPGDDDYVGDLDNDAAGNPEPAVQKRWVDRDDNVTPEIEGVVMDLLSHSGLNIRYLVTGYYGYGAAFPGRPDPNVDHEADPGNPDNFLSVEGSVVRESIRARFRVGDPDADPIEVPETITSEDLEDPDGADEPLLPFVGFRRFELPFEERQAVPEFTMTGPSGIYYRWQLQYGVQLATSGLDTVNLPLVRVHESHTGPGLSRPQ